MRFIKLLITVIIFACIIQISYDIRQSYALTGSGSGSWTGYNCYSMVGDPAWPSYVYWGLNGSSASCSNSVGNMQISLSNISITDSPYWQQAAEQTIFSGGSAAYWSYYGYSYASAANTNAANAASYSNSANTNAANAATFSSSAATNAANAKLSADTASTNAASASTSAANAASYSNSANTNAANAATFASTAATNAANAKASADTAATNAANASSNASTAATNAASAKSSADNANTSASNALNAVNNANGNTISAVRDAAGTVLDESRQSKISATNAYNESHTANTKLDTLQTTVTNIQNSIGADTTPPVPRLRTVSGAAATSGGSIQAVLDISDNVSVTFTYSLDGVSYGPVPISKIINLSVVSPGSNVIPVWVKDLAGNVGTTSITIRKL